MTLPHRVLVIGYGNRLRGDDAVGPLVADCVASWGQPGVETIAVHQLTPELAARLAEASRVLFVDAAAGAAEVICRAVCAADAPAPLGHSLPPGGLLGWVLHAYGRAPAAWLLTIPANGFDVGAALSPQAQAGLADALDCIRRWLEGSAGGTRH